MSLNSWLLGSQVLSGTGIIQKLNVEEGELLNNMTLDCASNSVFIRSTLKRQNSNYSLLTLILLSSGSVLLADCQQISNF